MPSNFTATQAKSSFNVWWLLKASENWEVWGRFCRSEWWNQSGITQQKQTQQISACRTCLRVHRRSKFLHGFSHSLSSCNFSADWFLSGICFLWWIWVTKTDGFKRTSTDDTFVRLNKNYEPGRYWGSLQSFSFTIAICGVNRDCFQDKCDRRPAADQRKCCPFSPNLLICEAWACLWSSHFRKRWALTWVWDKIKHYFWVWYWAYREESTVHQSLVLPPSILVEDSACKLSLGLRVGEGWENPRNQIPDINTIWTSHKHY